VSWGAAGGAGGGGGGGGAGGSNPFTLLGAVQFIPLLGMLGGDIPVNLDTPVNASSDFNESSTRRLTTDKDKDTNTPEEMPQSFRTFTTAFAMFNLQLDTPDWASGLDELSPDGDRRRRRRLSDDVVLPADLNATDCMVYTGHKEWSPHLRTNQPHTVCSSLLFELFVDYF
jgi:hypothetical protein